MNIDCVYCFSAASLVTLAVISFPKYETWCQSLRLAHHAGPGPLPVIASIKWVIGGAQHHKLHEDLQESERIRNLMLDPSRVCHIYAEDRQAWATVDAAARALDLPSSPTNELWREGPCVQKSE